jgi:3-methylcrotonyl-CoA carboxylase beta subunit
LRRAVPAKAPPKKPSRKPPEAMPLHSSIDPTSSDFVRNAEAMRALVAELRGRLDEVAGGGGEASRMRHT